jgi:hypothetical protein
MLAVIAQRDAAYEVADALAAKVAAGRWIGEHSSENNPWQNALDLLGPSDSRPRGDIMSKVDSGPSRPRPRPCASCPYRRDVPSGVWDSEEYDKLPRYDGDTAYQSPNAFMCHQQDGHVCSGWLGHREAYDLLAVRIGVSTGTLDPSCLDYATDVPLWSSGEEAQQAGCRDIAEPSPEAVRVMGKVMRTRGARASARSGEPA